MCVRVCVCVPPCIQGSFCDHIPCSRGQQGIHSSAANENSCGLSVDANLCTCFEHNDSTGPPFRSVCFCFHGGSCFFPLNLSTILASSRAVLLPLCRFAALFKNLQVNRLFTLPFHRDKGRALVDYLSERTLSQCVKNSVVCHLYFTGSALIVLTT